jgi:hypothetical protein
MSTIDQAVFNMCKKSLKEKVHQFISDNFTKEDLNEIFENEFIPSDIKNSFELKGYKVSYKASTKVSPDDEYESGLRVIITVQDKTDTVHIALHGWWSSYNGNEYLDQWSFVEPKTKVVTYYE